MSQFSDVNLGAYNRLSYDNCAYQKRLQESTTPLLYRLYEGQFENCGKCTYKNQFWRPFDLVDIETELKGLTRPNTKCPQFEYSPTCKKSQICTNTFDNSNPVVLAHEVCPIIKNNINKITNVGYVIEEKPFSHNGQKIIYN